MAASAPKLTPAEYLALERRADTRSEYWHGEMFAMAGASFAHDRIQDNLKFQIRLRTQHGACSAHGSDLKVGVHRGQHSCAYPDAFILCGAPQFLDQHQDVVTNPVAIFEILSPSTENHDRGRKFVEYRKLSSLRHYILIDQHEALVEHGLRQDRGTWLWRELRAGQVLFLPDLSLELPVDLLYESVEFPLATPEDGPA